MSTIYNLYNIPISMSDDDTIWLHVLDLILNNAIVLEIKQLHIWRSSNNWNEMYIMVDTLMKFCTQMTSTHGIHA